MFLGVFREDGSAAEYLNITQEVDEMKKLLVMAIALLVIGIAGTAVMADETVGEQNQARAMIHTMGALGYGIATSQADPMNFEIVKVGIAGINVTGTAGNVDINVGVLYFGDVKYKLKDVVIGNGTASANIYDVNGTTQHGSISLNSYIKGNGEVWAGTLTLDGAAYNAYIIQAPRVWKPLEKAAKVFSYCENNPEKCKAVMKAVGNIVCDPSTDDSCKDKIKTFCEQHPDDNRCKMLELASCKLHLEDANCRNLLIQQCNESNNSTTCDKLTNMYTRNAENNINAIIKNAPQWFKQVRERIKNKPQSEINSEDNTEGQ
jgi:hypothetical protein